MRTYKFSTPQQQDTVGARIYTTTKWEVKKGFSTSYNPKVSKFDLHCVNVIIKLKVAGMVWPERRVRVLPWKSQAFGRIREPDRRVIPERVGVHLLS